jgi:hypothetical protein
MAIEEDPVRGKSERFRGNAEVVLTLDRRQIRLVL